MGKNGEGSWKEIVEGSYPPQRGEEKGRIDSAVIGFESRGEMWDTRSRDIPVASTWELLWNGCNERNVAPSTNSCAIGRNFAPSARPRICLCVQPRKSRGSDLDQFLNEKSIYI